ncbi:MAG TPA: hypothetical protein VI451_14730 [Anaerolineales bacterium]|nr:hypothetical protein [Anaerolineales bacterium]
MRKMMALIFVFVLSGCGLINQTGVPSEKIAVESEAKGFDNLIWLPDGRLMVFVALPEHDVFGLRWYAIADEWEPKELAFPAHESCLRGGYYWGPSLLPDGRLSFLEQCVNPGAGEDSLYMLAYDLKSGQSEFLMDTSLPFDRVVFNSQYSWNPNMTLGMADLWGDVSSIYWISPIGYEFPDITISETYNGEARSWSLAENEAALNDPEKVPEVGMARYPAWSPDGNTIAFMATTGPIGRKYAERHLSIWSLYLMEPEIQEPEQVLTSINNPFLVKWSPDGNWLLLGGQMGGFGDYGYWLYSPESEQLTFILKNVDPRAVWSPDSTKIAYMDCEKFSTRFDTFGNCIQTNLNVLDVSTVTQDE